jgi:hypothetical protein
MDDTNTEEANSGLMTATIIILCAVFFIGMVAGFGCASLIWNF